MSYVFQQGDYIKFQRIIQAKREVGHRTDYETGKAIVVPEIPEQVLPQSGEGVIVKLSKPRKVKDEKFNVAQVYAGNPLGKVCAILDDAILVGKQGSLFEAEAASGGAKSIYTSDAKGIA